MYQNGGQPPRCVKFWRTVGSLRKRSRHKRSFFVASALARMKTFAKLFRFFPETPKEANENVATQTQKQLWHKATV
jgi:hypothetical protein